MNNSNDLIDQTVQEVAASSTSSATVAGPAPEHSAHLIDAINQVFALFRLNYHNQFYSAFSDTNLLSQAKRLWLETLSYFTEEQILLGAKRVIETSDYLPTLNRMLQCCEDSAGSEGLPSPKDAYQEACNAPSPKIAFNWSHLAVYYAGLETGWYRLSHESESSSYPAFQESYRRLCRDIAQGRQLTPLAESRLKEEEKPALNNEESRARLKELKNQLKLD
ncbi:MAG: replication protein P [Porticoccus sp.]